MDEELVVHREKHKGRVLVVDDEPHVREFLRGTLALCGHQVELACSGEEALQKVASQAPDAILLDVVMPAMSGLEVCYRLKSDAATAAIQILMVTGLERREQRLQGIRYGANDYLTKPVDVEEMTLRVENALYTKWLFDQNQAHQRELEERVAEQTRELRQANVRLQRHVRELEGRDQLVHFQMKGPELEETYRQIVEVIGRTLEVEQVIFYRPAAAAALKPVAARGLSRPDWVADARELRKLSPLDLEADADREVVRAFRERQIQQSEKGAAAPVCNSKGVLGVLWAGGLQQGDAEELNRFWRMAREVAFLLNAAQVSEDLDQRRIGLDELLSL